ncbi:MAG: hypothetical protein ACRC0G_02510 [Fusobacteriaceae bacterium]
MIKLTSQGVSVVLEGRVAIAPTLRGLVSTTTALGAEKTESIRGVVNISISVKYITEENFENLTTMFLTANNNISIEDTNRGKYYSNYYITGESMSLEEKEDIQNNAYYYVGGINLNKR